MRCLFLLCFVFVLTTIEGSDEPKIRDFKSPRIVGSQEAVPNSFPYLAALTIKVYGQEEPTFCGGSIITDVFILTAAHCVDRAIIANIVLGAHNYKEMEHSQQRFRSKVFMVHKQWGLSSLENDIALIRLPRPAVFNDAVQPISLPKLSDQDKSFTSEVARLAGWGKTSNSATNTSSVLNYIESTIVRPFTCKLLLLGKVGSNHICLSGYGTKSGCEGDSGGPLIMLDNEGKPVIQGIFSFIMNFGCERGLPQACTKVSKYLWWIFEHTGIEVEE